MKYFLTLAFCFTLVTSCIGEPAGTSKGIPGNFAHTVYFWLENPHSATDRAAFEKSLLNFLNQSEFIVTKHVGVPAATTHRDVVDGSYTYSLLLTFKNKADQDLYQEEAVHKQFIEEAAHLWTKVVIYDSETILE